MKDKKTKIAIVSVGALLLVLIGVTYAYWLVTKTQTNSNLVSSACLDITLDNESNDISLSSQYPMSDEDGMKLTPYTFIVTNNCNTSIDYQVALEATGDEATSIASNAIKVALDNNSKLYSNYGEVTPTISGAYESRSIGYARLAADGNEGSSVTHSLRIWIDENAPISEANKTFQSKISVTIGQGIDSPFAEGTLAYDILANNGGAGVSEIDATEKADRITSEGDVYVGTSENYYYGTEYTLDTETGKYQLSGTVIQATLAECRNGSKSCGKYTTKSTSTSGTTLYEITDFITSGSYVTAYVRKYTTPFAGIGLEPSLNKTQDDLGTSYYFRGAATNNYVQFGAYSLEARYYKGCYDSYDEASCVSVETYYNLETCESNFSLCKAIKYANPNDLIYWRIVRINGDGTIRLVYDGTTKNANGISHNANIGPSKYNTSGSLRKYAGYTYEKSDSDIIQEDSVVKTAIDLWYSTHLKANYGEYIADGIFCNDKEFTETHYVWDAESNNYVETTEDNAEYTETIYASYTRLANKKAPSLTCSRKEDRYTTKASLGNGLLEHPAGLLTADEAFLAGGAFNATNQTYYLYSGEDFWTSTPNIYDSEGVGAAMWVVYSHFVNSTLVGDDSSIRPVINLRADVEFTGNGSYETPYVIKTN